MDVLPEIPTGAPLIVVPDDALGVVPFEMLVLNQGGSIADVNGTPNITRSGVLRRPQPPVVLSVDHRAHPCEELRQGEGLEPETPRHERPDLRR